MTVKFQDMKVELVDHMGNDLSVVNAARVSFDKRSYWERPVLSERIDYHPHNGDEVVIREYGDPRLSERDQKLIKYLARHNHWTPFAHTAITMRVTCPIPIRTQCFKHKFGFVENEESRRYVSYTPKAYMPIFRKSVESKKQGSGDAFTGMAQARLQAVYHDAIECAVETYEALLSNGVAEEQARFVLPQGVMVNFVWTGSLSAYARFYTQRSDNHAQKEIQELAKKVSDLIKPLFPFSWDALTNKENS